MTRRPKSGIPQRAGEQCSQLELELATFFAELANREKKRGGPGPQSLRSGITLKISKQRRCSNKTRLGEQRPRLIGCHLTCQPNALQRRTLRSAPGLKIPRGNMRAERREAVAEIAVRGREVLSRQQDERTARCPSCEANGNDCQANSMSIPAKDYTGDVFPILALGVFLDCWHQEREMALKNSSNTPVGE